MRHNLYSYSVKSMVHTKLLNENKNEGKSQNTNSGVKTMYIALKKIMKWLYWPMATKLSPQKCTNQQYITTQIYS